jgi:phosphatidylglycerophosphate synthase
VNLRRFFTWLFTPLATRLVRVNPNALTVLSILAGAGAGLMFALAQGRPAGYAAAAALIAVSGAADAIDGIVARLSGRVSRAGELLDHFGDRLVDVSVLGGIALMPGATRPLGVIVIVLTLLSSYLGTQIEATFGVRDYRGPGKAEQFVGLIAFALVVAASSAIDPLSRSAAVLPDIFLVLLGAGTLGAVAFRLHQAHRLGQKADGRRGHDSRSER